MYGDRDRSDLGVPGDWDGLSPDERDEELRRLGLKASQLERPNARTPHATARQRAEAIASVRKATACGRQANPSQAKGLRTPCSWCKANPAEWCKRAGQTRAGFLHPERAAV